MKGVVDAYGQLFFLSDKEFMGEARTAFQKLREQFETVLDGENREEDLAAN